VDVLFGDYNPSGRLPVTFPRTVGQVPIYYDMKNTGRPLTPDKVNEKYLSRYLDAPNTPLYAFGFGLSYTRFEYSDISLDATEIGPGDTLTASVTVTNSGDRAGEEVVQLYVRDLVGSVARPVKQLKGFEKIRLAKGESRTVRFSLNAEDLAFYRADMSYGAEPGEFELFIGSSSDDVRAARFSLKGETTMSEF
jgi:beta-glucosidase